MYCSKCGSEQADAAKHCSQCGHALAVTSPQSEAYRAGQDVLSVALFRQRKASLLGITVSLLALCGAFAWLPQILEGRSSGCAALETRMVARLTTQQEVLGLLASGITEISDGKVARSMVSTEYPNIPAGFACQLVYWGERTGMLTFKSPLADEGTEANRRHPDVVTAPIEERLERAQVQGNEASAIGILRAINSSQQAFSVTCGSGFYARTLLALGLPAKEDGHRFISPDLSSGTTVTRNGYVIEMHSTIEMPADAKVESCNAALLAPSYVVTATPAFPGGRMFATNTLGTIFEAPAGTTYQLSEMEQAPPRPWKPLGE